VKSNPPPKLAPTLDHRWNIFSDPFGRALNRAVDIETIDTPSCLAIIQGALPWTSVWPPEGTCIQAWALGGAGMGSRRVRTCPQGAGARGGALRAARAPPLHLRRVPGPRRRFGPHPPTPRPRSLIPMSHTLRGSRSPVKTKYPFLRPHCFNFFAHLLVESSWTDCGYH